MNDTSQTYVQCFQGLLLNGEKDVNKVSNNMASVGENVVLCYFRQR